MKFYVIEPEPDLKLGKMKKTTRVKLGISSNVWNRLDSYVTCSPKARILGMWDCERHREREVIKFLVEKEGLRLVRGEVYDCDDAKNLVRNAEKYLTGVHPHKMTRGT